MPAVQTRPVHPSVVPVRTDAIAPDRAPLIDVRSLNFYYGAKRALEDITIGVQPNLVTAFIGPSGCGKSTFLRTFQADLEQLKGRLLEMGGLAEDRVRAAVDGLVRRDADAVARVIRGDRPINELHIDIDNRCFTLLALHQPMAVDLRAIVSGVKINTGLERVGDLAVNIAEAVVRYMRHPPVKELIDIPRMASIARPPVITHQIQYEGCTWCSPILLARTAAAGRLTRPGGRSAASGASWLISDAGCRAIIESQGHHCRMTMKTLSRHGRHADHHR